MKEGWTIANRFISFAFTQYIPFPNITNKKPQDVQLITSIMRRYHIRLWNIEEVLSKFYNWNSEDKIIGNVHYDIPRLIGLHVVPDFESPKQDFATICKNNNEWIVHRNKLDLGNRFAGYQSPFNDGRAIVIEKKTDG